MMSTPNVDPTHWNPAFATGPKALQMDAHLRLAIESAQPTRLRRTLQELCQTLPNAHKVTAALLLATQQRYIEKIEASKDTQYDEKEEEEDGEDDEDESEGDGAGDLEGISELSEEEEEEADEKSGDGSDDDNVERLELVSQEEDK